MKGELCVVRYACRQKCGNSRADYISHEHSRALNGSNGKERTSRSDKLLESVEW
jgi:hypothetical protein